MISTEAQDTRCDLGFTSNIKLQTIYKQPEIVSSSKIMRHHQRISEKSRDNETAGELRKAG